MKFYRLFLVFVAAPLSLLWLAASTAQATSVDLIFNPNLAGNNITSATPCTGDAGPSGPFIGNTIKNGECTGLIPGDQIAFAISITVDGAGVNAWSLDMQWDSSLENSLTLNNHAAASTFYRGFVDPGPPPLTIGYTELPATAIQQSTASEVGYVRQASGGIAQVLTETISNTSFRAGTATFTVDSTAQTDISLGFFLGDGNAMGNSASEFITPSFGVFQIGSVPEPGTSLLMGAGLFGLLIAGRSSRIRRGVASGLREVHDQRKHLQ